MYVNVFSIKKAASGHVDWHNMWSRNLRWYHYDRANQKFKYEWWLRTNEFKKSDYSDRSAKNHLMKSINYSSLINFENWNTHIYLYFGMMIDGFDHSLVPNCSEYERPNVATQFLSRLHTILTHCTFELSP